MWRTHRLYVGEDKVNKMDGAKGLQTNQGSDRGRIRQQMGKGLLQLNKQHTENIETLIKGPLRLSTTFIKQEGLPTLTVYFVAQGMKQLGISSTIVRRYRPQSNRL